MGLVLAKNRIIRKGRKTVNSLSINSPIYKDNNTSISLLKIFNTYNFINMWSAENITEVEGTTTAHDYAQEHDLANIGGEQPTTNSNNSDFGGKQSLSFNGTQGIEKNVVNYRGSDNTGMITVICKGNNTNVMIPFGSADNASGGRYIGVHVFGTGDYIRTIDGVLNRVGVESSNKPNQLGVSVITITCDSVTTEIFVNGIKMVSKVNSGVGTDWFNDVSNRDNISIGKLIYSSSSYGQMDWALTGVHSSVLSDVDIVSMHQDFMNYYKQSVSLAMSRLDQLNGIVNGWNYKFLNVSGTTTKSFDLKGQYDMSNPAASNQPILNIENIEFDGIDDYLYNTVNNWRSLDSTGVFHCYIDIINTGVDHFIISTSDEAGNNDYFIIQVRSDDTIQILMKIGGSFVFTRSITTISAGNNVLSYVQDGSGSPKIYVNGVVATIDGSNDTLGTNWLDSLPTQRDNLSMAGFISSISAYTEMKIKGVFYTSYVSEAKTIEEASAILESGL